MKIEIACACGKQYKVGPERLGESVTCTACGEDIEVEIGIAPSREPEPVAEEPKPVKAPKKRGTGRTARKGTGKTARKGTGKTARKGTGKTARKTGKTAREGSGKTGGNDAPATTPKASKGARKKATGGARRPAPAKKGPSQAVLLGGVAGGAAVLLLIVFLVVRAANSDVEAANAAAGDDAKAPAAGASATPGEKAPPSDGWVPYKASDGGYEVALPGAAKQRIESFDSPAGKLKQYVAEAVVNDGKVTYQVIHWDYPLEVPAHETFQEVEGNLLRAVPEPRQNLNQSDRKHSQGSPGRELRVTATFNGTKRSIVTYFYLVQKTRLIQLTVTSDEGAASLPDSARFLDSLQIYEW